MKVTLDHEGCIGCGLCVSTCPAVFGLAADGKAEVVQTPISEEEKEEITVCCDRLKNVISRVLERSHPLYLKKKNRK